MTSGTVGGQVGNAVGNFFERKYGKKKAKLIEAGAGFVVATFFVFVYLFLYIPISMNDIKEISFSLKNVEQLGSSKEKGTIVLTSKDDIEARLSSNLWKTKSSPSEILSELKNTETITLFVEIADESNVFGLKTGNLIIEPEDVINVHNDGRKWLLYLFIFFYVISVAELIWAFNIKEIKS